MGGQIRHRWATCDRPALVAAYRAAQVVDALPEIDHLLEALTLAVELREGSRRAGAALLAVHDKLGTAGAGEYRRRVRRRETPGNLVVVQGLVFRGVGLPEASAEAAAAHLFCAGLLGAALRLGLIGHVAAQRILSDLRAEIGDVLRQPAAPLASLGAFAPAAEIAVMRHEIQPIRLFAN
jgi:urease accessory protein